MPRSRFPFLMAFVALFASIADAAPVPKPPTVDGRAWILVDSASNRVLAAEKPDERMEPASLTKLMTAYLAFQAVSEGRLALDEEVPISASAWKSEGSRSFVQVGTRVPAEVLLKGMIVQSGNDATIAIAERLGGTETAFVEMMNAAAARLGMKNTHYDNSSGLPGPTQYTTARDIATLSRAMIRDFPQYYAWYSIREFTWNGIRQQNRNGLLARDPTVDGIKTGHTETAGYCLAASAKRGDMRLISVVFDTPSMKAREDASAALLNYGFTFYETVKIKGRGETVLAPRVYKGTVDNVPIGPAADLYVTVPRGDAASVQSRASAAEPLIAPLARNRAAGELVVSVGPDVVAKYPLYPLEAVPMGGWWSQIVDTVALWWQ